MTAPKGNRFWEARSSHGAKPKFSNGDDLWNACVEYFEWVEDNPLKEQKATQFQGVFIKDDVTKMRAMTIEGLCTFLDITTQTWRDWQNKDSGRKDLFGVIERVDQIIYNQKFSGAAADLLNANIIARDLGLADKKDSNVNSTISGNVTVNIKTMSKND